MQQWTQVPRGGHVFVVERGQLENGKTKMKETMASVDFPEIWKKKKMNSKNMY